MYLALRDKNSRTGERLEGKYFCAPNLILVDELSRKRIEEVVAEMINQEKFDIILHKAKMSIFFDADLNHYTTGDLITIEGNLTLWLP